MSYHPRPPVPRFHANLLVMTHLAVSIMVRNLQTALAAAARAAEFGADLIEWRIDQFTDNRGDRSAIDQLITQCPLPCILTVRPTWEGGDCTADDQQRFNLLEQAARSTQPPAYIDFELAAYQRADNLRQRIDSLFDPDKSPRFTDSGLILSAHDFHKRPADLLNKLVAMAAPPTCRVIKVAWQARSLRDNIEAFEIISQKLKPTIAVCMGDCGLPSRVLAKKFGALLTFAALDESSSTAPGQVSIAQMKDLYRWDRIDRQTRVYGVIGFPVGHSMSPAIHNWARSCRRPNGIACTPGRYRASRRPRPATCGSGSPRPHGATRRTPPPRARRPWPASSNDPCRSIRRRTRRTRRPRSR